MRYVWEIFVGSGYGRFQFTGTEQEAEAMRRAKARNEGAVARKKALHAVTALLLVLTSAPVFAAESPLKFTIDSKTGLANRTVESNLYNSVLEWVRRKDDGFSEAERECAKMTAAEAFLEATRKALAGSIINPLDGYEDAQRFFKQGQDDWCNKQGGQRGADVLKPSLGRVHSVVRPFIREQMEAMKGAELTPAQVAALGAAVLLAMPALLLAGT